MGWLDPCDKHRDEDAANTLPHEKFSDTGTERLGPKQHNSQFRLDRNAISAII
ncbi:hypothetical protein AGR7A_Cc130056 [Agrobacterium deltaense NCPPB 1641]|uniref:Uncharacterized protein n=1 Tax=Agrobacterium deltaense NCPPB 1641 TaxID=1183425 RepID=A0A1S7TJQ7_9HYPH|nr:hypothetical protein AGR7A_Cc130056 [Agrobacterium deltaense NCPPB 1641]